MLKCALFIVVIRDLFTWAYKTGKARLNKFNSINEIKLLINLKGINVNAIMFTVDMNYLIPIQIVT